MENDADTNIEHVPYSATKVLPRANLQDWLHSNASAAVATEEIADANTVFKISQGSDARPILNT